MIKNPGFAVVFCFVMRCYLVSKKLTTTLFYELVYNFSKFSDMKDASV